MGISPREPRPHWVVSTHSPKYLPTKDCPDGWVVATKRGWDPVARISQFFRKLRNEARLVILAKLNKKTQRFKNGDTSENERMSPKKWQKNRKYHLNQPLIFRWHSFVSGRVPFTFNPRPRSQVDPLALMVSIHWRGSHRWTPTIVIINEVMTPINGRKEMGFPGVFSPYLKGLSHLASGPWKKKVWTLFSLLNM